MNRRAFLKRTLLGGLVLAGGGTALWLYPTRRAFTPTRALKTLDAQRFSVLAAVAARTVTAEGADPVEIAHRIDELFSTAVPEAKKDFLQLLGTLENALAGFLLDFRPRPFTRLSGEAQDAALRAWRDSRMVTRRSGYLALRKLTLSAHYAAPTTWASVGYPGPPTLAIPT